MIKIVNKHKNEINNGLNSNETASYSIKEELIKIIIEYMFGKIDKGLLIVNFDQKGSRNAMYEIGLGKFFIYIGLFVEIFIQTFIYDRAKRYTKWYITKNNVNVYNRNYTIKFIEFGIIIYWL